ncbi:Ribosome maturation protein SBDS [Chondrus crispus]|uniref:Ribosome maturation protein SBDS n=1 Tax=Chondrus crispus TaxID=2769 RepID=R7QJF2_CHOCR|nr:Ribosome maturation protein SBDS [Chondrus crispus]CDF38229.1 Ribosome maturation protein SBDS [Chondrus crispus]|eukprot:XP_005718114.1 Ribosome maturation protein SBDS [Chondrus crispus]
MSLKQPVSQVRLTNVAVVRLKRRGKRFELACYKNKVISWREGNEDDLDEVLQTSSVFTNVSKGVLAKKKDLVDAFKTEDEGAIVLEILKKGELQVSGRERQYQAENLFNEIAVIVSEKCVDPSTKRPFSVGIIERAMRDTIHYAVLPNKTAKVQAQSVIKQLQEHMSISRAQMRLQISVPSSKGKAVREKLREHVQQWEQEEWDPDFQATVLVDPGCFRIIDETLREATRGQATFEVLSLAVVEDNDEQLL